MSYLLFSTKFLKKKKCTNLILEKIINNLIWSLKMLTMKVKYFTFVILELLFCSRFLELK